MKLVPVSELAKQFGVKLLVYGPAGTAKTPIIGTAPRPVVLSVETGTRSLANLPTDVKGVHTRNAKEIRDFLNWAVSSNEARNFDTICIDSLTEIAEMFLLDEMSKTTNLQRAYGEMGKHVKAMVRAINQMRHKHFYMIAQLSYKDVAATSKRVPRFPGQELSSFVPHEIDEIYYVDRQPVPPTHQVHLCWQTAGDANTLARSRSGKVDPFESPNIGTVIRKITT